MIQFDRTDLGQLEQRYRARLVNSLSGYKSANLVGTRSSEGQENLSIVSSVVHLGSNPALLGMIMRPPSVERHTYENILETGCYTLNHLSVELARQGHQTSARYERDRSEFEAVGLTPGYRKGFHAPHVEESPVQLGMELVEDLGIAHNGTRLLIGSIAWAALKDGAVDADGYVDLEKLDVVAISGLDSYHATQRLFRLSYAKPDQVPTQLTSNPS